MFLLGAGASIPAGVPAITELTRKFYQSDFQIKEDKINILRTRAETLYDRDDIEAFLSVLSKLQDTKELTLFNSSISESEHLTMKEVNLLSSFTYNFIRQEIDIEYSTDYMNSLRYFDDKVEIFTLNYDGAIEKLLENTNEKYTDGFTPNWNPENFIDKEFKFKLFKLHGSLYWFSTQKARFIKIQLKGLETNKIKFITGEFLSEILIYPTIDKKKYSQVYDNLVNQFIQKLNSYDLCIIIGYSFRDEDITAKIIEAMKKNSRLWLLIINRNSSVTTILNGTLSEEHQLRIFSIIDSVESVFADFKLKDFVKRLTKNIQEEMNLWNIVNPLSYEELASVQPIKFYESRWNTIVNTYVSLNQKSRARYIVSKLVKDKKFPADEVSYKLPVPFP